MSLENENIVPNQPANPITPEMQQSFVKNIWGDDAIPPVAPASETTPPDTPPATPPNTDTPPVVNEEVLDPNVYLKNKWGWETEEAADTEIKLLREKASKVPDEIKFNDEQSRQIYDLLREGGEKKKDVLKFLALQDKLENLVTSEVNEDNAAEIIKTGLKLKFKDLNDKEIDYKYNKQYALPKEPVLYPEDEESVEKHNLWKEQVDDIKTSRIIDAKTMKPDLEKAKSELVLPEINKGTPALQEPTPEELEALSQTKTSFLQSAKQTVDGFNGFTAQVKDKDVDFSVSYAPSMEEKTAISEKLAKLAEEGFDANALFHDRWYDIKTKTFKIDQMTEDLSRIFMGKNSDQKLATDAANKRMEAYIAEKKNVNVLEGNQNSTFQPNGTKTKSEQMQEKFWN